MKIMTKVISAILVASMFALSVTANDVIASKGDAVESATIVSPCAGYCAECGSNSIVHREYCAAYSVDGDVLDYSVTCLDHDSCYKRCVVGFVYYSEKCTSCGFEKSSGMVQGSSHLEFYLDETTREIVQVCTREGHM